MFSPHPDDDVIGCGGSIINHVEKGNTVGVVYITSGDIGSLDFAPEEVLCIREKEARKASQLLGVSEIHFLRNQDGLLCYTRENIIWITSLLRLFRPDIVYIPHKNDEHRDHRIVHDLVIEACSWAGSARAPECGRQPWSVGTILCYEVGTPLTEVNYVEDITGTIKKKIAAMRHHESQMALLEYDVSGRELLNKRAEL